MTQAPDQLTELRKHVSADDSFLVIKGVVYDAAKFLNVLSMDATKDVSQVFDLVRSQDALGTLPPGIRLELVNQATNRTLTTDEAEWQRSRELIPPAERMIILPDFEFWAQKVLVPAAWTYYRSAADQERCEYAAQTVALYLFDKGPGLPRICKCIAKRETAYDGNMDALRRYFFRPRMLRDMSDGSISTSILGIPSEMPVYIAPAAMAKLGHPLGEVNMTKVARQYGIIQSVSTNANCSLEDIFAATKPSQSIFYQVYIDKVRDVTARLLQKVERLGVKAIIFTVDVGWESKRTLENRFNEPIPEGYRGDFMAKGGLQDRNLSWNDISWIRRYTKLPIIVKGVQTIEDVELCVKHGTEGVMISNHGGRQLDYAPATIDILYELRIHRPDLFSKIEIMVDGGVRSGADVVKLLALGAKAVGFGRSFLYANATHGEKGVQRVLEILREEIINTMRNMGAAKISDLKPDMVGPLGAWVGANRPSYAIHQ